MRTVTLTARSPRPDPDPVFAIISDFSRYAELCESVREVQVHSATADTVDSDWAVNFRSGILKWSERDRIDPQNRRIHFSQTDGDFDVFEGSWAVDPDPTGTTIVFTATFDLGMPSLAAIIDPIAERTLRENMQLILQGLLGPDTTFAGQPDEVGQHEHPALLLATT